MDDLTRIKDYLDKAKVVYFTTVDGDKPKCRPFGASLLEDGKLYFGTGTFKECYRQIEANPNVEIAAVGEGGWLRLYGKAKITDDAAINKKFMDSIPFVKKMYEENGWKMGVFQLTEATAEFRDLMTVKEKIEF